MDKSGNAAAFLNVTCVCNDSGGNRETTDDSADTLYDPDSQGEIIVDLTDILNEFMRENAKKLQDFYNSHSYAASVLFFYNNVKDGGALDIKLQESWEFEEGKTYIYNDIQLRYDDPGNINFGYVGAVLFPRDVLCFGAGVNQISKYGFVFGNMSTFYDDPRDNEMIKLGYSIYWEEN